MILIVGGAGQGKLAFARERFGFSGVDAAPGGPVWNDFHLAVRDCLRAGGDVAALTERASRCELVLCDEIGCGVVPIDREERRWREETGRACQLLAQKARAVYRVVCGIPVCLKEEEPC